jgi:ferrous iron transport protein B
MAIFFPLFTLLEDAGYLPRIAFNLDNFFRKACAHGKQGAHDVHGFRLQRRRSRRLRIIDSPRSAHRDDHEQFRALQRPLPALIAVITMFFAGAAGGAFRSAVSALALTAVIV